MENQKKKIWAQLVLFLIIILHSFFSFPLRIILFMRARAAELMLCFRLIFLLTRSEIVSHHLSWGVLCAYLSFKSPACIRTQNRI